MSQSNLHNLTQVNNKSFAWTPLDPAKQGPEPQSPGIVFKTVLCKQEKVRNDPKWRYNIILNE